MTLTALAGKGWDPSNTIALAALGVAVIVPVFTLWWTGRMQRQARQDEFQEQRRREAAVVLGPVFGLLVDCDPDRLGINAREGETQERVKQLRERWESEIRPRLLAVRAGFPDPSQREMAEKLAVAVHNSITSGAWFAVEILRGGDIRDLRDTAKRDHEEARRLAEALAEAIRGRGQAAGGHKMAANVDN